MHKIEINLTDKELSLLKKFYLEQKPGSDNNLATRDPIHIVESIYNGEYIPVAYFFIYSEAEYYIKQNKYKLHSPNIVTRTTGDGYDDINSFYKLLQKIGEVASNLTE